jgi:hypothetical protein
LKLSRLLGRSAVALFAIVALAVTFGAAIATPQGPPCPTSGWAVGIFFPEEDVVKYYAHGPIDTWVREGEVELGEARDGKYYRVDLSFANIEFGYIVIGYSLWIEEEDYEPYWKSLRQTTLRADPASCAFYSEPDGYGNMLFFGTLDEIVDHTHTNIRIPEDAVDPDTRNS